MPWRWSLWSQMYANSLQHIEKGKNFLNDMYVFADDEQDEEHVSPDDIP